MLSYINLHHKIENDNFLDSLFAIVRFKNLKNLNLELEKMLYCIKAMLMFGDEMHA